MLQDVFRGHLILISVVSLEYLSEWLCRHNIKRSGSLGRRQMMKVLLAAVYIDHINCKIITFSFNHGVVPSLYVNLKSIGWRTFLILSSCLHVFYILKKRGGGKKGKRKNCKNLPSNMLDEGLANYLWPMGQISHAHTQSRILSSMRVKEILLFATT